MEVKFTEEQQKLILKNYEEECDRMAKFPSAAKATAKNFLLGCLDGMLSEEVKYRIFDEMILDTTIANCRGCIKMIRLFTIKIKCFWCGQEIPVLTTRPFKCPYCGGLL